MKKNLPTYCRHVLSLHAQFLEDRQTRQIGFDVCKSSIHSTRELGTMSRPIEVTILATLYYNVETGNPKLPCITNGMYVVAYISSK